MELLLPGMAYIWRQYGKYWLPRRRLCLFCGWVEDFSPQTS